MASTDWRFRFFAALFERFRRVSTPPKAHQVARLDWRFRFFAALFERFRRVSTPPKAHL